MKFLDVQCPACGAKAGFQCENLVKFRNKETGEMKLEYRVSDIHKGRKNSAAMEFMRQQGEKFLNHVAPTKEVVPVKRAKERVG